MAVETEDVAVARRFFEQTVRGYRRNLVASIVIGVFCFLAMVYLAILSWAIRTPLFLYGLPAPAFTLALAFRGVCSMRRRLREAGPASRELSVLVAFCRREIAERLRGLRRVAWFFPAMSGVSAAMLWWLYHFGPAKLAAIVVGVLAIAYFLRWQAAELRRTASRLEVIAAGA